MNRLSIAGAIVAFAPALVMTPPAAAATSSSPVRAGRGVTVLATLLDNAPRYSAPGKRARGHVPATWWGSRSILPVVTTRPGWVKVRLAQRPDGSQAWVRARDVQLSTTSYRIKIDLSSTRLTLYHGKRRILTAPAGTGAPDDPTPTGHFFVAFKEPPPRGYRNEGYGPFILVTSAHSNDIKDWGNSGDAVIGIHGPLGEDAMIGTRGARISHGCIRLHLATLRKLRHVPPGTPVYIHR